MNQATADRRRAAARKGGSAQRPAAVAAGVQRMSGPVAGAQRSPRPMADVRRASADASPVRLRLTRRGRVVVTVLAAMVAGGLIVAGAGAAQATSGSAAAHGPGGDAEQVVVQPGDTLWSIAERADPGSDTQTIVQEMLDLNRLTGPGIAPGQRLWVPRG
ncbi:MAG TPA: LysM peptidoglycan-binding domain-containing protein [Streptosporangiaceae bacterium]|nr:LysM peptidoglycan-binding domain-containing protein [Streptosporangiaceae bacterium]